MRFVNNLGKVQEFDEYGDPPVQYELVNSQLGSDGQIHFQVVGSFDSPEGQGLLVNNTAIRWNSEKQEVRTTNGRSD